MWGCGSKQFTYIRRGVTNNVVVVVVEKRGRGGF